MLGRKLNKSGGGRSSSQTLVETGYTAPSSVKIVINACHYTPEAGRQTLLPTENTITLTLPFHYRNMNSPVISSLKLTNI